MSRKFRLSLLLTVLSAWQPWTHASSSKLPVDVGASRRMAWHFQEDFSHGIPGWQSFPLVQDIGYDPSLRTIHLGGYAVLERKIIAEGQKNLRIGLLRPLRFYATSLASFDLGYATHVSGRLTGLTFTLAASDGSRYRTGLPSTPGPHEIHIKGLDLRLPAGGVEVEAVVIEGVIRAPVDGSRNQLIIRRFEVTAQRTPQLFIQAPALATSDVGDVAVSRQVVAKVLPLRFTSGLGKNVAVQVYDAEGKLVHSAAYPISGGRAKQISVPLGNTPQPGLWKADITSGFAKSTFRFLVLGKLPPHPRILLSPQRLTQLRHLQRSASFLQLLQREAKQLRTSLHYSSFTGRDLLLLRSDSPFPGITDYFALLENYSNSIAFNAIEYQLNGDQASLEAARRGLLTVASWPTWTPSWFTAQGLHTYYEVGVFTQRVALGYDLIADRLSPAEKNEITAALWNKCIEPTIDEYFLYDRMPTAASNWMANSVGGALEATAALYDDLPAWNARLGAALAELSACYERLLSGLFPGDGSEAEPAGYEEFAMTGLSWGMAALHSLGIRPRGTERFLEGFWWPRYAEVTPSLVLDTGDFHGDLKSLSGFAWGAEYGNDPSLRAFYGTAENGILGESSVAQTGQLLEQAPGPLDLVCCTHPSSRPPVPPPSRIFPLRGSAVLRSGWKSTDTVVSIRVGPWFNHEHHDQGSFQVAAFGKYLIAEAGYADYYKEPLYQTYFMQAAGHNTVLLDDDPFSQPGENGRYWRAFAHFPSFTGHLFSPAADLLNANLKEAYNGSLALFTRRFVFLKPDILVVYDKLRAPATHRYTWLLHLAPGSRYRLEDRRAVVHAGNAAAAILSVAGGEKWTAKPVPVPINRFADFDRFRIRQTFELHLESSPSTESRFLVAMQFQKGRGVATALKPFQTKVGAGFEAVSGEGTWRAVFRSRPGQLIIGDMATDGDVLALRQAEESVKAILVEGSRHVERTGALILSSDEPLDALMQWKPRHLQIDLSLSQATNVGVRLAKRPAKVVLDGTRVSPVLRDGSMELGHLGKGQHEITIFY